MAAVISHTVLIVAEPLAGLSAERVADAVGRGLQAGESALFVDSIMLGQTPSNAREWWATPAHAERMRAARAVVVAAARLDERTLAGSVAFEVATSARQAGVPAYAITADSRLDPFDARMLDLQTILRASSARTLRAAGSQLARML